MRSNPDFVEGRPRALADRRDERLGLRETFNFIGAPGRRIAVMSHAPLGPSRASVLVCSPILGDSLKNYRREVGLGRTLAARGISAYRFHYRGCGNSDGPSAALEFQTMCADALEVGRRFFNAEPTAFVGTRVGALVAANAATAYPRAPLALVEPTVTPASYYREGFRARMMRDLKDGVTEKPSAERLLSEMEDKGVLDLFGYPVDRNLYHSTRALSLADELPRDSRPILLVQMGGSGLRQEYQDLRDALASAADAMTTTVHGSADAWWFVDDQQPSLEAGLEPVADWLSSVLGEGS